ncbi:MAG: TrkH family potassium uptake protein [Planctomycetaceae bacterium]
MRGQTQPRDANSQPALKISRLIAIPHGCMSFRRRRRCSTILRMEVDLQKTRKVVLRDTQHPQRTAWLEGADLLWLFVGVTTVLLGHSVRATAGVYQPWEFQVIVVAAMGWLTGSLYFRYRWSLAKSTFVRTQRLAVIVSGLWAAGLVFIVILGPAIGEWTSRSAGRWYGFVSLSEISLLLRGIVVLLACLRGAAAGSFNPALLLVASFAGLVVLGTALLMLPRARLAATPGPAEGAPFVTALFTATSATCVTGLIVEDTPTYWSRDGQIVLLGLFQIGGLGIMTFGAFFGLAVGRSVGLREHATIGDILESEGLGNVRRLLLAILGFTLTMEIVGAVALSGLWSGQPAGERVFQSLFHSVSAFCNAGFSLTSNSFVGQARRWQVWGVVSALIVIGGLGFAVLHDLARFLSRIITQRDSSKALIRQRPRRRLQLTTRIVLLTTASLLVAGTAAIFVLERAASAKTASPLPLPDAWFQSVTFRTAGFNTVDMGTLHPSTKLLGILLMFIGASPGSTGGGVKTVAFSITVLGLLSVLKGREHVECFGRTLPDVLVFRALTVMFLSLALIMGTTILLVLYEDRPAYFLDYLFEAASAVGTVGVSSTIPVKSGEMMSVTSSLSTPSRLVIIVAMFLGRVGPLTLLMAVGGRATAARYHYPEERVTLG